jgi:DNA-binding MarR family transcriptional regulator
MTNTEPKQVPGFILERTARRMKQFFQQQLLAREADLTIDQWVVLQQLHTQDGQYPYQLAAATFEDRPTMTRILDLLADKGFVQRQTDPADRRRYRISLTAAGREQIARFLPLMESLRESAWAALTPAEVGQLVELLERVFASLEEKGG